MSYHCNVIICSIRDNSPIVSKEKNRWLINIHASQPITPPSSCTPSFRHLYFFFRPPPFIFKQNSSFDTLTSFCSGFVSDVHFWTLVIGRWTNRLSIDVMAMWLSWKASTHTFHFRLISSLFTLHRIDKRIMKEWNRILIKSPLG